LTGSSRKGLPAEGCPWEWGVYPWLEGEHPTVDRSTDPDARARDLARFVRTLQRDAVDGGPPAGRGSSLAQWDEPTRAALLVALEGIIDTDAATAAWEEALGTPPWPDSPVWVHGDLMPANLLVKGSRLAAVIDWGGFGLGDPAVDLMVAWNLLPARARRIFRSELGVDDATWIRGRGWALWTGLVALPYYRETNPALADNARYRIGQVLADYHGEH
jgi:aminoglycoside phosphotransferase (APT) family kinase protein